LINNRGRAPQNLILMPTKIRLQKHGRKGKPFFWIVAADSRAKRDGKYLEKLGTYNPQTNPSTVNLKVDNSVKWLLNGAQPTDTARNLLSNKGVMLKKHLTMGVNKGAISQDDADKKFDAWVADKEGKLTAEKEETKKEEEEAKEKALAEEREVAEKREEEERKAKEEYRKAQEETEAAAKTDESEPEANVDKEVEQETAEEAKAEEKKKED